VSAWTDPAWLRQAHAWIREHVDPVGPIEQPHVQRWATALRVPTAEGVVWFKASLPELAHEGPVLVLLSARRPDVVPPPVAVDARRGWTLSVDGGVRLRDLVERERDLSRWLDVLPRYAELQLTAVADVEAFLRAGTPDRRLAGLPEQYRQLLTRLDWLDQTTRGRLEEATALVDETCERLAAFGIPETIQHDDLHDAQVFVAPDGEYRILDWGDAVISHPFMTLAVTLDGVIQWGPDDVEGSVDLEPYQDAYLRVWGDPTSLEPPARLARRLGWILRAIGGVDTESQTEATRARLAMFLDGRV
jgi:hypothetical protein